MAVDDDECQPLCVLFFCALQKLEKNLWDEVFPTDLFLQKQTQTLHRQHANTVPFLLQESVAKGAISASEFDGIGLHCSFSLRFRVCKAMRLRSGICSLVLHLPYLYVQELLAAA